MNHSDKLIFPKPKEKIAIVRAENKNELKGYKVHWVEEVYQAIMKEFKLPYHNSILKLSQCSRNLSKNNEGPNVLYLSENEGCYPRTGLYIKEDESYSYYPNLNYIDLVLDKKRVEDGSMHIYSHEAGHVMLNNLWPNYPEGQGVMPHVGVGITDYYTAFNEGFAEQFEGFAYEQVKSYQENRKERFKPEKNFLKLWLSEFDSDLRYESVIKNKHIYKKLLPDIDLRNMSIVEKMLLEHVSPNFDSTRLKNAQEMLSSEGVIATIFYNINSDSIIQNNYLGKEFYNVFLITQIPEQIDVKKVFSPFENAILKNLWVIAKMSESTNESSIPMIEFIETWCECFPEDKKQLISIFIALTVGKTIENNLSEVYQHMAFEGMLGKLESFMYYMEKYRTEVEKICIKVLEGDASLAQNIGEEIWITNKNVNTPEILWASENKIPLKININTASIFQLMSFPKITKEVAESILSKRDNGGCFKSIKEFEGYFI